MTCVPVFTQLLSAVSFMAYGSVLLAPPSPRSMYINPTLLAGGFLWAIQAPAHAIALASPHIGSGLDGSACPGIHVHCPVPWCNVRILPSAPIAMTVASLGDWGAADSDS